MIDWDTMLYDPQYTVFGKAASLVPGSGGSAVTVTIIDETAGIEIDRGSVMVPTIKPAAAIRMAELVTNGLTVADLVDGTITFNSVVWTIKGTAPKPGPDGKGTGEALLILFDGNK